MEELDLILKEGQIVTASDIYTADLAISDGKIRLIGSHLDCTAKKIVNAKGKYVLPGGIDVHTHLDMPFGGTVASDNFETGTIAAACGGTTTIVDFAIQPQGATLAETAAQWQEKAAGKAAIDYAFHIAITDMNDAIMKEMPQAIQSGYSSFKLFMTYDGFRVTDDTLLKALKIAKEQGGLVCVHAENYYIIDYLVKQFKAENKNEPIYHALSRPNLAEAEAVNRAITMAKLAGAPLYIVHLSCRESLEELKRARALGLPVMAETCPQYLLLDEDKYREPDFAGAKYVMSPPLRHKESLEPLWKGLKNGDLQAVATDHCPFFFQGQKEMGRGFFGQIPNGAPGVETRMMLLFGIGVSGKKISLQKMVEITATNPAKIFGMYPRKGTIAVGSDADLVLFDPARSLTIIKSILHEHVDYTPYEGFNIQGYPVMTIAGGKIVAENGTFTGKAGTGNFIKRSAPVLI
ncbi:metal-dependent hydrolase [Lucifera butyrica]|uniref:Metal-dependent hydrolase n=1 Tax=Lucifera butyrica TaxID=1351585 RepID=A0A498R8H4_9FIRM|nr:dihydropyrimidinase [Lucifera butyrica]VBB07275.1 metal-dependent hydrolase [Lucifera butyrica]